VEFLDIMRNLLEEATINFLEILQTEVLDINSAIVFQ